MNDNDKFDDILDEALADYSDAEPLAGMEHRVLQRVRMHAERRKVWLSWSALAVCTAMLAVAVWIGLRERDRHEILSPQATTAQQPRSPVELQPKHASGHASPETAPTRPLVAKVHPRGPNVADRTALGTTGRAHVRAEFPTPEPLNSEERALLALAQTHPEILSRLADRDDHEIAIAPITIEPLAGASSGKQGEN